MHNVNILTIHKEPNYGAVLQAYALYKTIENLGHVPYIINLDMDYSRFPYSLKYRVLLGLHKWMKGYSHCFALAERFSRKHCPNQIGNFHTTAELESYPWNKDDYYLIGSDQVWNPGITQNLRTASEERCKKQVCIRGQFRQHQGRGEKKIRIGYESPLFIQENCSS